MLSEGDKAPAFTLASAAGRAPADSPRFSLTEALKEGAGRSVVLYFYPKDDTPGCTREAQAFSEGLRSFAAAGASVVGVSKDSIESHCKFRDKYRLSLPLLSDPDLAVHKAYGAYGEKTMYGKKVLGVIRSTFLIGPDGKIRKAWRSVKVDGHADAVLAAIRSEGGDGSKGTAKAKAAPKKATKTPTRKR